jgi:hypothetical protein
MLLSKVFRVPAAAGLDALAADTPHAAIVSTTRATSTLAHARGLSSDNFEARAPGSAGEEKTVAYLISEFKRLSPQPGKPDGAYLRSQTVFELFARSAINFVCLA